MPTAVKELARVNAAGQLVKMSLVEWATRFNADHRLAPPKATK